MVLLIENHIVFATGYARYHSKIYLKPCGVNHCIFFTHKFCKASLKLLVNVERSIEEWRAGTSGSILLGCFIHSCYIIFRKRDTCARKLRMQKSLCAQLIVFAYTSRFRTDIEQC